MLTEDEKTAYLAERGVPQEYRQWIDVTDAQPVSYRCQCHKNYGKEWDPRPYLYLSKQPFPPDKYDEHEIAEYAELDEIIITKGLIDDHIEYAKLYVYADYDGNVYLGGRNRNPEYEAEHEQYLAQKALYDSAKQWLEDNRKKVSTSAGNY